MLNKPIIGPARRRLVRDLSLARLEMVPEEFLLMKEMTILMLVIFVPGCSPRT
jgi:hypothetical protein